MYARLRAVTPDLGLCSGCFAICGHSVSRQILRAFEDGSVGSVWDDASNTGTFESLTRKASRSAG